MISPENLGHKLTAEQVINSELHCDLGKYNLINNGYEQRIQELTKIQSDHSVGQNEM